MTNTNAYSGFLGSLCSPLKLKVDNKIDDDSNGEPPTYTRKEIVGLLLYGNKFPPIFKISMNDYKFIVQYMGTKSLNSNDGIHHCTLFYKKLKEDGYGPSYNEICWFERDAEVVKRFCKGVLSDILGDSQEKDDELILERSMLSSLIIGPELIRAKPSLAVSVMGMILAFMCPKKFDEILYRLMWFTQIQGGNHFRFIGSKCVKQVFDLLVKVLSNGNLLKGKEISTLIQDMIKVAYEQRHISAIRGYQSKLESYINSILTDRVENYVDEILEVSEGRFHELYPPAPVPEEDEIEDEKVPFVTSHSVHHQKRGYQSKLERYSNSIPAKRVETYVDTIFEVSEDRFHALRPPATLPWKGKTGGQKGPFVTSHSVQQQKMYPKRYQKYSNGGLNSGFMNKRNLMRN